MSFYDNDYNRKLSDSINNINYSLSKRDNLTNVVSHRLTGGARQNDYIQDLNSYANNTYVKTGTNASYPFLNANELSQLDNSKINYLPYQVKTGKGKMSGGFSWSDVGNFLKPIASTALDALVPVASAYTGSPNIVKGVREGIRGATGVGLKRKAGAKSAGVGNYSGGAKRLSPEVKQARMEAKQAKKQARMEAKQAKMEAKQAKKQARMEAKQAKMEAKQVKTSIRKKTKSLPSLEGGRKASEGTKRRAEIVKKVMKEMGMKMIDASKYVKNNGLYKK